MVPLLKVNTINKAPLQFVSPIKPNSQERRLTDISDAIPARWISSTATPPEER
jgi:hypothetical protein